MRSDAGVAFSSSRAVFVFGEYSLATEAIVSKDHQTISDHLAYPLLTFVHM
jgi:hypothetical protein